MPFPFRECEICLKMVGRGAKSRNYEGARGSSKTAAANLMSPLTFLVVSRILRVSLLSGDELCLA